MLKPSDINPNQPTLIAQHLTLLEEQFDTAITAAATTGNWPARVDNYRDMVSDSEIEHVADKYRAEGWLIITGQRSERATIHHPNRQR